MPRLTLTILTVLLAILGGVYQLHFKPWLKILGLGNIVSEGRFIVISLDPSLTNIFMASWESRLHWRT